MKLSAGKITDPGAKQVFRSTSAEAGDVLALRGELAPAGHEPLLEPVMRAERRVLECEGFGTLAYLACAWA